MSRRKRTPTDEDLRVWKLVADTVSPLPDRKPPEPAEPAPKPAPKAKPAPPPAIVLPPELRRPKAPPSLATMDKRMRSRVSRGAIEIDRRVDLHGLTQAAAERRLVRFLEDAQAEGAKVVLVITGKGKAGSGDGAERGVLRRMVPHWLSAPTMRAVVVGFEEASPRHGGTGALYVRLRRLRDR
jgi:DNA-nicking Smr family endonuclease